MYRSMIGFSVRFAVPLIFLVTAASALPVFAPGAFSAWLRRNRKYVGLCFAVAMAWQGLFIAIMSMQHRDYYFEEIYFFRDELEGSTGYLFLTAMVLTSFRFGRKYLDPAQWKLLHRSAVYFLWAYPFSTYWWNLSYYPDPQLKDYVFYWAGFFAVASRIAAWGTIRMRATAKRSGDQRSSLMQRAAGGTLVVAGTLLAIKSLDWQEALTNFLSGPDWSANLELWLPFWPFEPFLSLDRDCRRYGHCDDASPANLNAVHSFSRITAKV